jgi:hypothetical protein
LLLPLLAFLPLRFGSDGAKIEKKILFSFVVLFILYAFLQIDMRIRYVAPIVPPAVILAIYGFHQSAELLVHRWKRVSRRTARTIVLLVASILLTYNGVYICQQFGYVRPFDYLSGKTSRDEYIIRHRPEYAVIQYINKALPPNSRLLALFLGNRGYYCDREVIFGDEMFKKMVQRGKSPKVINEKLQNMGMTYLLIRYDLFKRWADSQFDNHEKKILNQFITNYLMPLYSEKGYGLFEVKPI